MHMKRGDERGSCRAVSPRFGTIVVHSVVTCDKWFLTVIPALTCKLPDIKVRADKEYVRFLLHVLVSYWVGPRLFVLAINCIPIFPFSFGSEDIVPLGVITHHHIRMDWQKQNKNKNELTKSPHWSTNKQTCSNKITLALCIASYNDGQNTTRVKEMQIWTLISMLFHRWMIVLISLCVHTLKHPLRKLIKTNIYHLLAYFTYFLWLCVSLVVVVEHLTIGV